MKTEFDNYTLIVQGPPPNGSLNQLLKILRHYSRLYSVIYTSTNIKLASTIKCQLPSVTCCVINDVGQNSGKFIKPLNINRFITGVQRSLKEVQTERAIILRSDICLNIRTLINLYEISGKRIGVSSITTKFFGIRKKWINHVCDWYYIGTTADLNLLIDCPKYPDKNEISSSSVYPISPERFLWENFCKKINSFTDERYSGMINLLSLAHISHPEEVSLTCTKKEYAQTI